MLSLFACQARICRTALMGLPSSLYNVASVPHAVELTVANLADSRVYDDSFSSHSALHWLTGTVDSSNAHNYSHIEFGPEVPGMQDQVLGFHIGGHYLRSAAECTGSSEKSTGKSNANSGSN